MRLHGMTVPEFNKDDIMESPPIPEMHVVVFRKCKQLCEKEKKEEMIRKRSQFLALVLARCEMHWPLLMHDTTSGRL